MDVEFSIDEHDAIEFAPHNDNVFTLIDVDTEGGVCRIWVAWSALPKLKAAIDAAIRNQKDASRG